MHTNAGSSPLPLRGTSSSYLNCPRKGKNTATSAASWFPTTATSPAPAASFGDGHGTPRQPAAGTREQAPAGGRCRCFDQAEGGDDEACNSGAGKARQGAAQAQARDGLLPRETRKGIW